MCYLLILFNFVFFNKADWPLFGGNSAHTGYKDIDLLTNGDGPFLLWTKSLNTAATYATVSNNRYYTVSSGNLYVLDASNGNEISFVDIGSSHSIGPPIIAFNKQIITQMVGSSQGIYVNSYSISNNYHNIWQATGSCQWPSFPYGSTPSDTDQFIYFPGGRYNGVMYAVNSNGSQVFSAVIAASFGCDYWTPTVYKGRVFMNSQRGQGISGYLAEIDNKTGSVLWKLDLYSSWDGYSTYWVASITNNIAIVHSRTVEMIVSAVDLRTHQIMWNYTCSKPVEFSGSFKDYTASIDGVNVFVACSDGIKSLDLMTGQLTLDYVCSNCGGQPIVTNDTVIINSYDGVKIFGKNSGELIETLDATGMIALSDNRLFITNNKDGIIKAYLLNLPLSDSSSSQASNGNTGMIVVIVVVCIIIFIFGVLMGYCLLKYKIKNEMNNDGKSVMNSIQTQEINKNKVTPNTDHNDFESNYLETEIEGITQNHNVVKESIGGEGEAYTHT